MKLNKNEQNYLLTILFKSYILQSVICSGIILVCTVSLDMGLTWVLDRYVEHYYLIYRGLYVGNNSVQDDIRDIKDCVDAFSYYMASNNKVYKKSNSVTYKVSLLMKSPQNGREIKIESSDGNKDIYTLQNASYESAQLAASIYAHNITIYKVAPGYTYYYE